MEVVTKGRIVRDWRQLAGEKYREHVVQKAEALSQDRQESHLANCRCIAMNALEKITGGYGYDHEAVEGLIKLMIEGSQKAFDMQCWVDAEGDVAEQIREDLTGSRVATPIKLVS